MCVALLPAEHPAAPGWFYPGSGAPSGFDASALDRLATAAKAEAAVAMAEAAAAADPAGVSSSGGGCTPAGDAVIAGTAAASVASTAQWPAPFELGGASTAGAAAVIPPLTVHGTTSDVSFQPLPVPEPLLEAQMTHPHIINVGMPHPAAAAATAAAPAAAGSSSSAISSARQWRRIMTLEVLPRLAAFKPDLILVSAG